MFKQFFKISFYAFITFCVVSFLSLFSSILYNRINDTFPNFKIGFPFTFYYQFLENDECNGYELHHGFGNGLIENIFITWIIVFLYFTFKNYKQQTINNNNE